MSAVEFPPFEPRHPHSELLEELVLPLTTNVRGREDQGALHLAVEDQSAKRDAGGDRFSETDFVRDKPRPGILVRQPRHHLPLVRLKRYGARSLCESVGIWEA